MRETGGTDPFNGLNVGTFYSSISFVDINNDSWEDLLVANGFITTEDSGDL